MKKDKKTKKTDGMYDGFTSVGLIDHIMKVIYGKGYAAYGYKRDKSARHFEFYLMDLSFTKLIRTYKTYKESRI